LNCDCAINIIDIDAFILALLDPVAFGSAYPGCDIFHGDMNHDGAVDGLDIHSFVTCILGGGNCA